MGKNSVRHVSQCSLIYGFVYWRALISNDCVLGISLVLMPGCLVGGIIFFTRWNDEYDFCMSNNVISYVVIISSVCLCMLNRPLKNASQRGAY